MKDLLEQAVEALLREATSLPRGALRRRSDDEATPETMALAFLAEARTRCADVSGRWRWRELGVVCAQRWPDPDAPGASHWMSTHCRLDARHRGALAMLALWGREADPRPLAAHILAENEDAADVVQRLWRYYGAGLDRRSARGAPPKGERPRDTRLATRVPHDLLAEVDAALGADESRADLVEAALRGELERRRQN